MRGLTSYKDTVGIFDSKLVELDAVRDMKANLLLVSDLKAGMQRDSVRQQANGARAALGVYEQKLKETVQRRRDPDGGFDERQRIQAMQGYFNKLDAAIQDLDNPRINAALADLRRTTDELYGAIYEDLFNRITKAKSDSRSSVAFVVSTSLLGIVLMTGLLRFFYRWTFYPLRDLQAGVNRVAKGDFEHSIEVHSNDEMEELAGAFNDMTRRLRDIYGDLARQVNERSRQLVRSERLASVGFLAAGVAHEINNPLASIAFCSEALEGRLKDMLSGKAGPSRDPQGDREIVAKYLKMIQEEAFRCKNITQRLLEFSRGGESSREPTDLAEIVQGVIEVVGHLPNSRGKKIAFEPDARGSGVRFPAELGMHSPGRLIASVNAEEIKSVVLNLVVNALDSMDEGGTLTIAMRQRDGAAEMEFEDMGCGMTPDVLENIFEPFFTRSRTGKGTGLGLSISHRIVNQHGGEIEAASAGPGKGSTFTVRIPLKPPAEEKEGTLRLAA